MYFNYFLNCWKNALDFGGKSRRVEYWSFAIINTIINLLILSLSQAWSQLVWISIIYLAASILPYSSLLFRRMRDTGFSMWYLLLILIPYLGTIVILIIALLPSKNRLKFDN